MINHFDFSKAVGQGKNLIMCYNLLLAPSALPTLMRAATQSIIFFGKFFVVAGRRIVILSSLHMGKDGYASNRHS